MVDIASASSGPSPGVAILGIAGSPRGQGLTTALVEACLEGCAEAGARTELRELSATRGAGADLGAIERSDGFVFGSPTYRGTHTSLMGSFLERIERGGPHETSAPLKGKAAAVVMSGGSQAHFLAPAALEHILSSFFAVQVLAPSLFVAPGTLNTDGGLTDAVRQQAHLHGRALVDLVVACRASQNIAALEPQV